METHVKPIHNSRDESGTGDGYRDRSTKTLEKKQQLLQAAMMAVLLVNACPEKTVQCTYFNELQKSKFSHISEHCISNPQPVQLFAKFQKSTTLQMHVSTHNFRSRISTLAHIHTHATRCQ